MQVGDALFLMALTWSLGCTAASDEGRAAVDGYVRACVSNSLATFTSPSGTSYYTPDFNHIEMSQGSVPPTSGGPEP